MKIISISAAAAIALAVAVPFSTAAQTATDSYDDFLKKSKQDYSDFLGKARKDYTDFRDKANSEYADFLSKPWTPVDLNKPKPVPKDRTLPPQRIPKEQKRPAPPRQDIKNTPIIDLPPQPAPPQPLAPVTPPAEDVVTSLPVTLYGTSIPLKVSRNLRLPSVRPDERGVADAWRALAADGSADATIASMLDSREALSMPDWMYYRLACTVADRLAGRGTDAAELLKAYMLNQSGYAVRLGIVVKPSQRLVAMPGATDIVYGHSYYAVDGANYFAFDPSITALRITGRDFSGSRPMDLNIRALPKLEVSQSAPRTITCVGYPGVAVTVKSNENLMKFFDDYPAVGRVGESTSKWGYYARVPLSEFTASQVLPALRRAIAGKSELEAANILINFCESIPYAYDNEVWGHDRAFFADESLYYPGGDCEDHAILFVRLVKELMGLPTALVYFPGHLAAAVQFTTEPAGTTITADGERWTLCDPTIFYAPVGTCMSTVDRSAARLLKF